MAQSVVVPQVPELTDWRLVTRNAVVDETDNTDDYGTDRFFSMQVSLFVQAVSGSSPTLDVYVQRRNPSDGEYPNTYDSYARFAQMTTTSNSLPQELDFIHSGNAIRTTSTLPTATDGTVINVNMGGFSRIYWTMSGTWTFRVYMNGRQ